MGGRIMTAPATANQVAMQLAGLARDLDLTVRQLQQAEVEAVDKRHAADLAEAHAYLSAEGSVENRKRLAFVAVERLIHEAETAEAVVRHLRRRIDVTKTRVEIGRSLGAALRAEAALVVSGVNT